MAQREMSSKALLDKLYSGLDTMPAVEVEMNAGDLRRLNDEFLGKPTEPTASDRRPATASRVAANARPASRMRQLRLPLLVLLPVALVGVIAAGALRESDKRAALPPPEPVVLVNPFDATEKFTFPPGTSKADARDQMATLLLQRAAERGAHRPRARKLAAEPRPRSTGHGS